MDRRTLMVGAVGLFAASAAFGQRPVDYRGPPSVTIPLMRTADGKLWLNVAVQGRTLAMFLDTGATTVIDIAIAHDLGVDLVDTGQKGFGMTGGVGKRINTHVDLQLGALEIFNLPVDCLDLSQLRAVSRGNGMPAFDGVIGAELLTILQARIDFASPSVTLKRPVQQAW